MPLLWISLAFLTGIVLAASISLPTWVWADITIIFSISFAQGKLLIYFCCTKFITRHPLLAYHPSSSFALAVDTGDEDIF